MSPSSLLSSSSSCSATELLQSNYRHLGEPDAVRDRFVSFLLSNKRTRMVLQQSVEIQDNDKRHDNASSLEIQVFSVLQFDPILGHMLLRYPSTLLPLFEDAAVQAQQELLHQENNNNYDSCHRFRIRLVHLPPNYCCNKQSSHAVNVGRILQTTGTVVRASPACMMEFSRCYTCTKCQHEIVVQVDLSTPALAMPQPPPKCPSCDAKGTLQKKTQNGSSTHADYQQVKIKESVQHFSTNDSERNNNNKGNHNTNNASTRDTSAIPRSILLQLTHDLVDACKPGDEIVVVGTLQAQWPVPSWALTPQVDYHITTCLLVHSIRVMHKQDPYLTEMLNAAPKNTDKDANNNNNNNNNPRDKYPQEFEEYWNSHTSRQQPVSARNFIVGAMCPKLYGLFTVKFGLLLTLIGGSSLSNIQQSRNHQEDDSGNKRSRKRSKRDNHEPEQFSLRGRRRSQPQDPAGWSTASTTTSSSKEQSIQTKRRAQSHILLVGEAGQGKSQLLKFAAALSPRSVLTTGTGCSSAGLTAAAVRDPNRTKDKSGGNNGSSEFTLEAGALVLADMGVCCIDEFGCIRQEDRTTIHEAMEQQTISVAKAGIVCKLNARATVVAVMNPTKSKGGAAGSYDFQHSLEANTNLASPLLSRFDLIFLLLDTTTAERDSKIASFLLNHAIQPDHAPPTNNSVSESSTATAIPCWSMDKLRAYIAIVKSKFHPTLSSEAATLLQRYYQGVRSHASFCQLSITVRFLESLIRLSQAHARLMYRNVVTLDDAVSVILVMEQSCASTQEEGAPLLEEDGPSEEEFANQQNAILVKYGMIVNASTGPPSNAYNGAGGHFTLQQPYHYQQQQHRPQQSSGWEQYQQQNNLYGG